MDHFIINYSKNEKSEMFFTCKKNEYSLINYYAEMTIEAFDYSKISNHIKLTYTDIIDNLINYLNFTFEYLL